MIVRKLDWYILRLYFLPKPVLSIVKWFVVEKYYLKFIRKHLQTAKKNFIYFYNRKKKENAIKMEMKHIFMIVLVILGVCSLAHSLQCWDCHSDDGKDCEDTSTNIETTCQSAKDSCSKVIVEGKVSKGCAGLEKPAGCKQSGKTTVCYCHDDFCNSAGSFQIYPVLIVSLILASLLTWNFSCVDTVKTEIRFSNVDSR